LFEDFDLRIYGLILFPSANRMIEFKADNVFKSMVALKINLVVAILIETFSSLNHYRKTITWDVVYNCYLFGQWAI
jgi:hypothetical protein